jgi:hypothetical protein
MVHTESSVFIFIYSCLVTDPNKALFQSCRDCLVTVSRLFALDLDTVIVIYTVTDTVNIEQNTKRNTFYAPVMCRCD